MKRKRLAQRNDKKSRRLNKQNILELCGNNTNLAVALKLQGTVGRPRVEVNQFDTLGVIKEIAVFGVSADDRRCTETIRC